MNYVVLDLEWNQPFSQKLTVKKPVTLFGEIVQIGAVKLNGAFGIVDTFKAAIAPKYYTKMHGKVARLTHIASKDLKLGLPFPDAIARFKDWCGDGFSFITWGCDDIKMLKDNLAAFGLDDSWVPANYDLQIIFDDQITREGRQISLTKAAEILSIEARDAHDALNDAYNTAIICPRLDMAKGFASYVELESRRRAPFDGELSFKTGSGYKNRHEAFDDGALFTFVCDSCGAGVRRGKLISQCGGKYVSAAKCSCGREFFYRLRLKKNSDGTLRASSSVYLMDGGLSEYYEKTRDEHEKRKRLWLERQKSPSFSGGATPDK